MARHVKGSSNHLRHSLCRPQFCAVAVGNGALHSKILSSRRSWLRVSLLGRPGENRTRRESAPRRRHSFRQRITELAAQWRRRAISFKENSSSNSFSARLRRSESNSAEPFGRIWTSCHLEVHY